MNITTGSRKISSDLVVGLETMIPVVGGQKRRYVNLDNAATTPTLRPVLDAVNRFLPWYSNVHRGTSFKSRLASWAFEEARARITNFVAADSSHQVVVFSRNTTEAVNHLARRFPFRKNGVVMTTVMEHHSNELPWRKVAKVVHVGVLDDGRIDEEDFQRKLHEHKGKIQLVAVTGASNVTGYVNPVHTYARWAHAAGAKIFVDAALLAPHRPIDLKLHTDPEHLDYLAFSAHKMYAPFGLGVLVGERRTFDQRDPDTTGGGPVDIVSLEEAYWTNLADKEESGTPDIVGAVALGAAIRLIEEIGWDSIIEHEAELTTRALERLGVIPGVRLYGDTNPATSYDRLGVISFGIRDIPHALVAAVMSYEWAIGTRNGHFCAYPYVKRLMHVSEQEARAMEARILRRDRSALPGAVRASFGISNTREDVDIFCEAVGALARGEYRKDYALNVERGEYYRLDMAVDFREYVDF